MLKYFPSWVFTRVPAGMTVGSLRWPESVKRTMHVARLASCRVMPNRAASASSASPVEVFKSSARPLASTYCITW